MIEIGGKGIEMAAQIIVGRTRRRILFDVRKADIAAPRLSGVPDKAVPADRDGGLATAEAAQLVKGRRRDGIGIFAM